ncbi:MAG: GTP pyrophosphokinase family protein, partial [Anaerotignum sp.]|nr:GTP pyrophosphokinase family protein [Anaerotignum sp.]
MEIINWKELLYPYEQAVEELLLKFNNLDKECRHLGIYSPIDSVSGRLKKPASILDKAGRKHIPPERIEEEIEDIAGIRILCQFVEDIQKVVDMIRTRTDMTIVQEKDYVTNMKPSGYRSYHIIIKYPLSTALGPKVISAEIQVRTNAMNFWATAEHSLRYKYSGNIPEEIQDRLTNCAGAA